MNRIEKLQVELSLLKLKRVEMMRITLEEIHKKEQEISDASVINDKPLVKFLPKRDRIAFMKKEIIEILLKEPYLSIREISEKIPTSTVGLVDSALTQMAWKSDIGAWKPICNHERPRKWKLIRKIL